MQKTEFAQEMILMILLVLNFILRDGSEKMVGTWYLYVDPWLSIS